MAHTPYKLYIDTGSECESHLNATYRSVSRNATRGSWSLDDQPTGATALTSGAVCKSPTARFPRGSAIHCSAAVPTAAGVCPSTCHCHAQHHRSYIIHICNCTSYIPLHFYNLCFVGSRLVVPPFPPPRPPLLPSCRYAENSYIDRSMGACTSKQDRGCWPQLGSRALRTHLPSSACLMNMCLAYLSSESKQVLRTTAK